MLAEKRVELRIVGGAVFGAKPPTPVTALGSEERFLSGGQGGIGGGIFAASLLGVESAAVGFTRVPEQIPGSNIFSMTNPDIEVGVNPGSGKNSAGRGDSARRGNGFAGGECAEVIVVRDATVEFAKELAAIARVIFPGIFAVKKKADGKRILALHGFTNVAQAGVEILGRGGAVHAAVHEAD